MSAKWDRRFLAMADLVASWSKDPSTQVGAVIVDAHRRVVSVGFNGFPQGMPDLPELYADRTQKYSRIIHGEINALLFAGQVPPGSTLYTVPFAPCDRCAVQMLQAGIRRFVTRVPTAEAASRWGGAFELTRQYIREVKGVLAELDDSLLELEDSPQKSLPPSRSWHCGGTGILPIGAAAPGWWCPGCEGCQG